MLRQEAVISRQRRQIRHLEVQPGRSSTVANDASVQTYTDRSSMQLHSQVNSTFKYHNRRMISGDSQPFSGDPSKITTEKTDPELALQNERLLQNLSNPSSPVPKLSLR